MDSKPKVMAQLYHLYVRHAHGIILCINTYVCRPQVTSHLGPDQLSNALYDSHLVIIPAGVPRKPGMTRDDLFNINAGKYHQHAALLFLVCKGHSICAFNIP